MTRSGILAVARRRSTGPAAPLHLQWDSSQESLSDGATVTSLTDRSGNGYTGTHGGTATTTFTAAGLNGKTCYTFGSGSYYDTATFTAIDSATAITLVAVGAFAVATALMASSNVGGTSAGSFGYLNSSTNYLFDRGGATISGGVGNTSPHRFILVLAASGATASTLYVDGTAVLGPSATGSTAMTQFRVGADASGNNKFTGRLSELRLYRGALSTSEIAALDSSLALKWGF